MILLNQTHVQKQEDDLTSVKRDVMLHSYYTVSSTSQNKWHLQHYYTSVHTVVRQVNLNLPVLHFTTLEYITHTVRCYLATATWAFISTYLTGQRRRTVL